MPIPMLESDDIEVIRCQFEAWMNGVHARFLGIGLHENPHPSRTAAGDAWGNAWGVTDRLLDDMHHLGDPLRKSAKK